MPFDYVDTLSRISRQETLKEYERLRLTRLARQCNTRVERPARRRVRHVLRATIAALLRPA